MGFKGLTVNTLESEEAHIFAEDDAAFFKCILGTGNMILPYGERFSVSILESNKIKVGSGMLVIQGHVGTIPVNDYEEFVLENGTVGVVRYDYLVATFETNGLHGIDSFQLEILSDQSYQSPDYAEGDLDYGATKVQFPLARIKIDGLAVSEAEMLNTETKTIMDLIEELNSKIKYGTEEPSGGSDGDIYIKIS